ncbi:hypothetical protein [Trueperella pyogenes]|nr:hypothetical protein [Trueperella pyogenes]MCI7688939.1 hypothetical protein [Trueperella pyogenes]
MKTGEAKYATPRNPANPTLGPIVDTISELVLGQPPMPWQRQVNAVANELSTEHPGEFRYNEIIITVPRQAGKSHVLRQNHAHRLLAYRDHLAVMTAQTGKDAGKRWRALAKTLEELDPARFRFRYGNGHEEILFKATGSTLSPFAPTKSSLHGDSLHMASIDEAWAFTDIQGAELEGAIKPTMLTITNDQLWIVSTRGTANSTWLNQKIELGRASLKDPGSRVAFFEWSADEELAAADPYSDETLAFHPAIGHTQTARKIRDLGSGMSLGEWRRAYLNLPTEQKETAIDLALWSSLAWDYDADHDAERYRPAHPIDICIAWDIALDGSTATIAAGWLDLDGNPATQIVATAPGTKWLSPMLRKLYARGYRVIISDDAGPNRTLQTELAPEMDMQLASWKEYGSACQALLDRVREGTITHDGHAALREAIECAAVTRSGNVQTFNSGKSTGAIDALRATALAAHAATTRLSSPLVQIF